MASRYTDPRDFVLHIRGELLSEYLKKGYGWDFPAIAKKDEKREESADRFMSFVKSQEDETLRDKVFMELEYINSLSSQNHIQALCISAPNIDRQKVIENRAENYDERALLAFINYPKEFDTYYSRANIEELGVSELTLPSTVPIEEVLNDAKIRDFEPKVQEVYRVVYKGEKCKIKTYPDGNKLLIRAYLEDLPTRDTAFDGKTLNEKIVRKPVFDVVFIYNPDLKMLGVRAIGGKQIVSDLKKLFCAHFLGIQSINTDAERYSLASAQDLANLKLTVKPSYGVERVYLKSIRLKNKTIPHKLFVDVAGRTNYSGTDAVQEILKELHLDTNHNWEVETVKITVIFNQVGKGRRKQVTVTITPPNTCDLKNRPQDDTVRQMLKDWGIYVA